MSKVGEVYGVIALAAIGTFVGYAASQLTRMDTAETPASPAPIETITDSAAPQPVASTPPISVSDPQPSEHAPIEAAPSPAPEPTEETSVPEAEDDVADFTQWETLSPQILEVIEELAASKTGLGYDLSHYYTEDLSYGGETLTAKGGGETMCVAAVAEIMIRAVDRYAAANPETAAFESLPGTMWTRGALSNLRPWLYVFKLDKTIPTYNRPYGSGTHDALILFGIGRGVKFSEAEPGDLVNFNRSSGSGHAAVFLGYLNPGYEETNTYSDDVVGFRYFSAQGSGNSGLDYRHAFFGSCPTEREEGIRRDCNIIRTDNPGLFSMARLHAPQHWRTEDYLFFMDMLFDDGASFEEIQAARYVGEPKQARTRSLAQMAEYNRDLPENFAVNFSGETEGE